VAVDPNLRRDAADNRERILTAAREVFNELGVDADLKQIALRAGVGRATVYRRFPTRELLLDALLEKQLDEAVEIAESALRVEDPWEGLAQFIRRVAELPMQGRGLSDALARKVMAEGRDADHRAIALVGRLIDRARDAGVVRDDLTVADVRALTWLTRVIAEATPAMPEGYVERYLEFVFEGIHRSPH
jgi:AcrR family transcriptional regulator